MSNNKKKGMTSVEAAALYLSDGQTTDPNLAVTIDNSKAQELRMDDLQKAHIRRMMGFDFRIKIQPNKIHVSSKQDPYVTTWTPLNEGDVLDGRLTNEAALDRLVDACLRCKLKYEAAIAKLESDNALR